jgi:hypothetical protein
VLKAAALKENAMIQEEVAQVSWAAVSVGRGKSQSVLITSYLMTPGTNSPHPQAEREEFERDVHKTKVTFEAYENHFQSLGQTIQLSRERAEQYLPTHPPATCTRTGADDSRSPSITIRTDAANLTEIPLRSCSFRADGVGTAIGWLLGRRA